MWQGAVGLGKERWGLARSGRARLGGAGRGVARLGEARLGEARLFLFIFHFSPAKPPQPPFLSLLSRIR